MRVRRDISTGTVVRKEELTQLIRAGADRFGIVLMNNQLAACMLYIQELKKWGQKINLTSITDDREIAIKHFLDSFTLARGFTPRPGLLLLDMGSGAGFPALPLKIAFPDISATLVESVKKKASFLRHMVRTLGFSNVEIADERTSLLPDVYSGRFDVVTARAFANMGKALAEGARFLKSGGLLVLSRGPSEDIGQEEVGRLGYYLDRTEEVTLPYSDHRRVIWIFRKQN